MGAIGGGCHCGNLTVGLHGEAWRACAARACTCGFCRPRHARWISAPTGEAVLGCADESALSRYRFATETAEFLICRRCGLQVAATCEIDGSLYAVINPDCAPELTGLATAGEVSFDGESVDDRLARRARSWTPARW